MKKILLALILIFTLFVSTSTVTFAANKIAGFDGLNKYSSIWHADCGYGNRAGATYVSNLYNAIQSKFDLDFKYTDNNAWEADITDYQFMNNVDFFAFSGHGLNGSGDNAMHFYVKNGDEAWHSSYQEWHDSVNAYTFETRFGHDKLKWVTIYSCNWLTNNGSQEKYENIMKTFEGATLQMGFASVMFLDSREGTRYGQNLMDEMTIKDAFIEAAQYYQVQRTGGDSIARVCGYIPAANNTVTYYTDTLNSNNWYINNSSQYDILHTVVIPHTGETR